MGGPTGRRVDCGAGRDYHRFPVIARASPSTPGRTILAARVIIFVTFLDLFIQFPVVAPYARDLGASPVMIGFIVGIYSALNLVGNLVTGVALDRWGRRRPVLLGLAASVASLFGYALAATPEHLLGVRALHGVATAVLTPGAFALIGDNAAIDRRARTMGVSGAIIAVAAVLGPPLGGMARDRLGFGAPFVIGAILMAAAGLAFLIWAREAEPVESTPRDLIGGVSYLGLWTRGPLVAAYLTVLAFTIGLGVLVTHLPLILTQGPGAVSAIAQGGSGGRNGLAFTVYAVVAMALMAGPANRISDARGRYGPIATGLLLIAGGTMMLASATGYALVLAGMGLFGFGFGLLFPPVTALIVEVTIRRERGAAFGIFYAIYSLGVVIGSVASGFLAELLGSDTRAPFFVSALVASIAAPAVFVLGRAVVARAEHSASA